MPQHLKKFSRLLESIGCDAYLVVDRSDMRYLTGISCRDAWLLVTPRRTYYLTDGRYLEEIRQMLPSGFSVRKISGGFVRTVFQILSRKGSVRLGFDEHHFTVAQFRDMKQTCPPAIHMAAKNGCVAAMRWIKTAEEVDVIRQCLQINLAAYRYLKRVIRPGMTEREIFFKAERFVRSREARFSFLPIIASGPNSSRPHSQIGTRVFRRKEVLLVDMGVQLQGYKSDLTRIFVFDKIPPLVARAYQAVAEAQEAAIREIRPGAAVARIDAAARKSLKAKKLDQFFVHATGHGVGLDIHESPRLSVKSSEILQPGMVMTVEPGVYFPGKFGIRIEDMVLVNDNGCEILSRSAEVEHPFILSGS